MKNSPISSASLLSSPAMQEMIVVVPSRGDDLFLAYIPANFKLLLSPFPRKNAQVQKRNTTAMSPILPRYVPGRGGGVVSIDLCIKSDPACGPGG